jgi:hypothetical protein
MKQASNYNAKKQQHFKKESEIRVERRNKAYQNVAEPVPLPLNNTDAPWLVLQSRSTRSSQWRTGGGVQTPLRNSEVLTKLS